MLLIYTGEGKGKTSASVGQALRAHGSGLRVAFGQFLKRDGQAGEQAVLKDLLGERFLAGGQGFFRNKEAFAKHRAAAIETLGWAMTQLESRIELLVLDETLYALGNELVTREEIEALIASAARNNAHLVLSGRGLPQWLAAKADLITEMLPRKHHFDSGVPASKGIEF
jgi:cob(I)alamin adenosyltransferase